MDPLTIHSSLVIPPEELQMSTRRAGGPGGQNVNKVASAVDLRFDIRASRVLSEEQRARLLEKLDARLVADGVLLIRSSEHRTQHRNLEAARARLAQLLREALRRKRSRKATRPTLGSKRRRLSAKKQRSEVKKMRRRPADG